MAELDKDSLETLMAEAGMSERSKKKLRDANKKKAEPAKEKAKAPDEQTGTAPSTPASPERPRGHGAAAPTTPVIDDL